jgi:DNA-binding GntR family transcriptional regulator
VGAILSVTFALHRRSLLPMEDGVVLHERVFAAVAAREADGAEAAMLAIIDGSQAELARAMASKEPGCRPAPSSPKGDRPNQADPRPG